MPRSLKKKLSKNFYSKEQIEENLRKQEQARAQRDAKLLKMEKLFEVAKTSEIFKTFQSKYPHCAEAVTSQQEVAEDGSKLYSVAFSGWKTESVMEVLFITVNWETEQIVKTELIEDEFLEEYGYWRSELYFGETVEDREKERRERSERERKMVGVQQ